MSHGGPCALCSGPISTMGPKTNLQMSKKIVTNIPAAKLLHAASLKVHFDEASSSNR